MTAADLIEIIRSPEFRTGLDEISSYLASIMQEDAIVHLIAKSLWNQRHVFVLEREDRHDLTMIGPREPRIHIEVKFKYDFDAEKLIRERKKSGDTLDGYRVAFETKRGGWSVLPELYKDIIKKKPHLFVLVVLERDLASILDDEQLIHIANSRPQTQFRRENGYRANNSVKIFEEFLRKFQTVRPFTLSTTELETTGNGGVPSFPSTYHFFVCEFGDGSAGASPSS